MGVWAMLGMPVPACRTPTLPWCPRGQDGTWGVGETRGNESVVPGSVQMGWIPQGTAGEELSVPVG